MQSFSLEELKPTTKPKVIDLVAKAGLEVADWGNCKGGPQKASSNPKYCYEWCFEQEGLYVFNLWFENLKTEAEAIYQHLNIRTLPSNLVGIRRVRANRFDEAIRAAYETGSNPRVIILHREEFGKGSASARMLDQVPWTVVKYDYSTGDIEIRRGIFPANWESGSDPEAEQFKEGEARRRFVNHRKREARLRQKKIEQYKKDNDGRLFCEVPRCGFDFEEVYGELGQGYAQVHHLVPLSEASEHGKEYTVKDLKVVCANCHVMIHKGGECRDLDGLIPN